MRSFHPLKEKGLQGETFREGGGGLKHVQEKPPVLLKNDNALIVVVNAIYCKLLNYTCGITAVLAALFKSLVSLVL